MNPLQRVDKCVVCFHRTLNRNVVRLFEADGLKQLTPNVFKAAGLAEFERELIHARTGEGRKRAKDRGVKFGRPTALTPHQRQEAIQRLANGDAQADVARTFNVSQATISRLAAA